MAYNFLQSVRLLSDAAISFTDNCVVGIEPRLDNIKRGLDNSLMLVTPLKEKYGYDRAAKIAKTANKNGTTLREEAIKDGIPADDFDRIVVPAKMIGPDPE
jgi:fumarate hydratase class II